jgi:Anti-sigma factor NepR
MAAPGGLAEHQENKSARLADEGQARPAVSLETTSAAPPDRRLRIVHSAETPSFNRPVHSRPIPRPVQASAAGDSARCEVVLDRAIQGQIGGMLRDVFADVANEPVPPRFVELLEALGAQQEKKR